MRTADCVLGGLERMPTLWSCRSLWLFLPVALLAMQISSMAYLSNDAISYLSMAQSFADTGVMLNQGSQHLTYAAGWPALLSVVYRIPIDPILGASILMSVLGLVYLAGVYVWCRRVSPRITIWVTCLAICNVTVTHLFRRPLSEPLFMCLLLWSTFALQRLTDQLSRRLNWWLLGGCCLLLAALCVTRQVGVFLVAGWGLQLARLASQQRVSWQQSLLAIAMVGLCSGGTVLAFILYDQHTVAQVAEGSNWDMLLGKSQFGADYEYNNLGEHLLEGLRIRIYEIGRLLIPGMYGSYAGKGNWLNVNTLIYLPLAFLCCFGWWRLVIRHCDAYTFMVPLYVVFYIYWPSNQSGRFFAPLLPVLFVSLWKASAIIPWSRQRWGFPALLVAHSLVAVAMWLVLDYRDNKKMQDQWNQLPAVRRSV
jgi:hypothetical protein